jgi:hypothetical protein
VKDPRSTSEIREHLESEILNSARRSRHYSRLGGDNWAEALRTEFNLRRMIRADLECMSRRDTISST